MYLERTGQVEQELRTDQRNAGNDGLDAFGRLDQIRHRILKPTTGNKPKKDSNRD